MPDHDPSPAELAAEKNVTVKTIRRWIAHGYLDAYRMGPRLIRVRRDSVTRMENARPIGTAPASGRRTAARRRSARDPR